MARAGESNLKYLENSQSFRGFFASFHDAMTNAGLMDTYTQSKEVEGNRKEKKSEISNDNAKTISLILPPVRKKIGKIKLHFNMADSICNLFHVSSKIS